MEKSRLKEHEKQMAVRNILFVSAGLVILGALIAIFGIQFLINFSLSLDKLQGSRSNNATNNSDQNITVVAPPVLDPIESATNSAQIDISGYALSNQTINLYVNGNLTDKTTAQDDRTFVFKNIQLESGDNEIKAKVVTDSNKESNYSNAVTITYNNKNPSLTIDSPSDGQTYTKDQSRDIPVTGKSDTGDRVTVNGFWAIVDDQGKFSYTIHLQDGDNPITVDAIDDAGNKTEQKLKVTYSS